MAYSISAESLALWRGAAARMAGISGEGVALGLLRESMLGAEAAGRQEKI